MSSEVAIGGVVDNLVTQFASALDCFRELVQNSIDAGTSRVDVWAEFERGEGHVGTIAFHVDDFGEGMDEKIIDNQLTRLFASTKENDLTKIGKFGIGFVSVFALKPKAVLLQTGRGGEYWEVLFHEDRSFVKSTLDNPVEGTQITIFLEGDYHRYRELVDGVRATLKRWCRHSETEVTYEDRSPIGDAFPELEIINEDFAVEGICHTAFEEPGTTMALAYTTSPVYGFYNRGLTLAYTEIGEKVFESALASRLRFVSVKVKSRYLEHTLSRDSVVRDEHYHKVMNKLLDVSNDSLLEGLLSRIEEVARTPDFTLERMHEYARLFEFLMHEPEKVVRAKLLDRRVFRTLHGGEVLSASSVWQVMKREGQILMAEEATSLSEGLHESGVPVLLGHVRHGSSMHPLGFVRDALGKYVTMREEKTLIGSVKRLFGFKVLPDFQALVLRPEQAYLAVRVDEKVSDDLKGLLEGATRVLDEVGIHYKAVATCVPAAPIADAPVVVMAKKLQPVMRRPTIADTPKEMEAAVNRQHPHVVRLAALHATSPALAEYCLARVLLLDRDAHLEQDGELMRVAQKNHGMLLAGGA